MGGRILMTECPCSPISSQPAVPGMIQQGRIPIMKAERRKHKCCQISFRSNSLSHNQNLPFILRTIFPFQKNQELPNQRLPHLPVVMRVFNQLAGLGLLAIFSSFTLASPVPLPNDAALSAIDDIVESPEVLAARDVAKATPQAPSFKGPGGPMVLP